MSGGPHMMLLSEYTGTRTLLERLERGLNHMTKYPEQYESGAVLVQRDAWEATRIRTQDLWNQLEVRLRLPVA